MLLLIITIIIYVKNLFIIFQTRVLIKCIYLLIKKKLVLSVYRIENSLIHRYTIHCLLSKNLFLLMLRYSNDSILSRAILNEKLSRNVD